MKTATYRPEVFEPADLTEARRIILTPTAEMTTEERWAKETPYVTGLLRAHLAPTPGSVVIDYGCGVGRLSGALIAAAGCRVLGVDSSAQMRAFAGEQVSSPLFAPMSRGVLEGLCDHGLQADHAFAVWVLQHAPMVEADIALLARAVRPGGKLFVVNMIDRAIPAEETPWISDGKDVRALVGQSFTELEAGSLDADAVGRLAADRAYWAAFRR